MIAPMEVKLLSLNFCSILIKVNQSSPVGSLSRSGNLPQTIAEIRTQSILFAKLFVVMGITWIGECIHVQLHGDHSELEDCSFYSEVKKFL